MTIFIIPSSDIHLPRKSLNEQSSFFHSVCCDGETCIQIMAMSLMVVRRELSYLQHVKDVIRANLAC